MTKKSVARREESISGIMAEEEDRIEAPAWISQEYVTNALRDAFDSPELQISSFAIKCATAAGENYASRLFRAQVQYKTTDDCGEESKSLLLKVTHDAEGDMLQWMNEVWDVESAMLRDVLPRMDEIVRKAYPDHEQLAPQFIWRGTEPSSVIIMQDLREFGYDHANRIEGMDSEVTYKALEYLALFHASSLALKKSHPDLIKEEWNGFMSPEHRQIMEPAAANAYSAFLSEISTWEHIPKKTIDKLNKLKETFVEKIYEATDPDPDELKVLVHGDCWINNFMFSKQEDNFLKFRFVDFQCGHLNSPATDLNYFLFSSPSPDIRISSIEQFLSFYYKTFMEAIERFDVTLPCSFTFEDFVANFKKRLFYGFFTLVVIYPVTVCTPERTLDYEDIFGGMKDVQFVYRSKKFKEAFNKCLPYLLDNNVF